MKNHLFVIFLVLVFSARSQDKLFFGNGKVKTGTVVSITKDLVFFKQNDTSFVQKIPKSDLLLIEKYNGTRYLFSDSPGTAEVVAKEKVNVRQHSLGAQPFGVFFGRITAAYEHFTKDGKMSIVVPFSLTFDPTASIYKPFIDTTQSNIQPIQGVSFITGLDVNFYFGRNEIVKFFMGPRFRYGTDMLLDEVRGYSLQTQVGWKISNPQKKRVQHFSIGYGFVRVLSYSASANTNPNESYGWLSINYRIGILW